MRVLLYVTTVFLALPCLASSFIFPPQGAVFDSATKHAHARVVKNLPRSPCIAQPVSSSSLSHARPIGTTDTVIMMSSPRGGKDVDNSSSASSENQDGGIEPKYLVAVGVVVLAALYDLFVTHQGRLWEL